MLTLRPLTPTLFPYTTLFRSNVKESRVAPAVEHAARERLGPTPRAIHVHVDVVLECDIAQVGGRDSTRLSVTHRCMSYAVFRWALNGATGYTALARLPEATLL